MKPLFITSLGTFTSVGTTVAQTMGSLLTKTQMFEELDIEGPSGEPVFGAISPLPDTVEGPNRLLAMAQLALQECARESRSGPDTLIAALPAAGHVPLPAAAFLHTFSSTTLPASNPQHDRVFLGGKLAVAHALQHTFDALAETQIFRVLLGGADSLVEPLRVRQLLDQSRLLDGAASDGFIPGEGAAFIRIEKTPGPAPLASIAGFASSDGAGALSVAATHALRAAEMSISDIGHIVHDGSGSQASVTEISSALTRLAPAPDVSLWAPALSLGETGAAGGIAAFALAAFFIKQGVFLRPTLILLTTELSLRCAVVVSPVRTP